MEKNKTIPSTSTDFKLPEGWIVEEKARSNKPSHIDRYYYEPYTGRKFRSLSSVQRHISQAQATQDHRITERTISKDTNTNTSADTAERDVGSIRSYRIGASSSAAQEGVITPGSSKQIVQSEKKPVKLDDQKEINSEKNKGPVRHLSLPPPEEVTWVFNGPENSWDAMVDDNPVTEVEKLKWAAAFFLASHRK